MNDKEQLKIATEAIYSALTCALENNGNIMADAVEDHLYTTLSMLTDKSIEVLQGEVEQRIEEAQ